MHEEVLGQLHVLVESGERHLRLDHPELGQMAPRLGLLRAERGTEDVHLAEGEGARLGVELAALREIRRLAEVLYREQRGGALARGRRQDRRIEAEEAVLVKILPAGTDQLGANAEHRVLTA